MSELESVPSDAPAPRRRGRPPGPGGGRGTGGKKTNGATVGYEAQLWQMADALRGSMDAAEYKHVALGLIFLKYISDAFEEQRAKLLHRPPKAPTRRTPTSTGPRTSSGCPARRGGRASRLRPSSPPSAGSLDDAMEAIERDNPGAQGRAPQGLRPPRPGQAAPGPTHRPHQQRQGGRPGEPLQGRARPGLRVLPLPVRERRRQEGRRVLHRPLRGQAAGGDARALPGPRLRPLLRVVGHVRAVGGVHTRARLGQRQRRQRSPQDGRRHLHLRSGIQLHHLAPGHA